MTLLLAATAFALIVAGCGGGGDSGSTVPPAATVTTSSLSKDEFVKQAAAACNRAKKDILTRVLAYMQKREHPNETRPEGTALFAKMTKAVALPTVEKEIAEIRNLGAPAGDEDEIGEFVASEQKAIDEISKLPHIVSRFQIERYFGPSTQLAREYGIAACGNSGE